MVLVGRMGEAIDKTSRSYPGLLEHNQDLLFMLKCRQFVEMVNGSDVEVCPRKNMYSPPFSVSPRPSSPVQTSVIQSTKSYSNKGGKRSSSVEELNQNNANMNGNGCSEISVIRSEDSDVEMDTTDDVQNGHTDTCNGKVTNSSNNGYQNGNSRNGCPDVIDDEDDDMGKQFLETFHRKG